MSSYHDYSAAREVWQKTGEYESVLQHLRREGLSKIDSIKALRETCGVSLGEAKFIANKSDVWSDTVDETDRLHDAIEESIERDK